MECLESARTRAQGHAAAGSPAPAFKGKFAPLAELLLGRLAAWGRDPQAATASG